MKTEMMMMQAVRIHKKLSNRTEYFLLKFIVISKSFYGSKGESST